MKTPLLALTIALVLAAGCAQPASPPSSSEPASTTSGVPIQAAPQGQMPVQDVTQDAVFVLQANAGPSFPLRTFAWTIPAGAIVTFRPFAQFGDDFEVRMLYIELLPAYLDGEEPELESYAIGALSAGTEAELRYLSLGQPLTMRNYDALVEPEERIFEPTFGPRLMGISAGDLQEGDEIILLFGLKAAKETPVGLLLHPLGREPGKGYRLEDNRTRFLANRTLVDLPLKGEGAGIQYAYYHWTNIFSPPFAYSYEITTGPVTVTDGLPRQEPLPLPRDVTVAASFDKNGYTEGSAYFSSYGQTGVWDASVDFHGVGGAPHSVLVGPGGTVGASLVLGYPYYYGIGEGSGPATSSLHVESVASGQFTYQWLNFVQLDLGATMTQLTGVAAATGFADGTGLVGNVPPARMARLGDDLVFLQGDRFTVLEGAAALAPEGMLAELKI